MIGSTFFGGFLSLKHQWPSLSLYIWNISKRSKRQDSIRFEI